MVSSKMKINSILFLATFLCPFINLAQGVLNNGARIVFTGPAQMLIENATGNYLSQAGGFITPSASSSITLRGNWINNSTNNAFTTDGGGVVLAGAAQTIGGTNATAFYNLTLAGSGTKLLSVNGTTVCGQTAFNGILSMGTRPLDLNGNRMDVTNAAAGAITQSGGYIISETNAAINPSIVRWYMRTTAGSHVIPFGVVAGTSIPFTFNITTPMTNASAFVDFSTRRTTASDNLPWAGASNVGAVSFMYCPNNTTSGNVCAAGSVIDRWWDITNSHAVTADLTFSYLGAENTLLPAHQTGLIGAQFWDGSNWVLNNANFGGTAGVTAGVGNVTATGQSTFCPWVLTSKIVPLPVELLSFSANCESNDQVVLNWMSVGDQPGYYYELQSSTDGINFARFATVNANTTGQYKYVTDNRKTLGSYYRLKMIDNNLNARLSKIENLSNNCDGKELLDLFYNPNTGIVLNVNSSSDDSYQLMVHDVAGKLVMTNALSISKGYNSFKSEPNLANGIYMVSVVNLKGLLISKKIPVFNQ